MRPIDKKQENAIFFIKFPPIRHTSLLFYDDDDDDDDGDDDSYVDDDVDDNAHQYFEKRNLGTTNEYETILTIYSSKE